MFGIPIEGETQVLCDNEAVINSSPFAEATLKKKLLVNYCYAII